MTVTAPRLVYKLATEPEEFSQIHQLNYRTFVEEIPQHHANEQGILVDRFDRENTYHICRDGDRVIGMIAVRGTRPFSLDQKIADLDRLLPPGHTYCELRLLAVDPKYRNGAVFHGLVSQVARYCLREGFDAAIISGTVRQLKLYSHLGFVPFAPLVGSADALYQPMYITLESLARQEEPIVARRSAEPEPAALRFLPGPVDVHPDVLAAFAAPPISHRGAEFHAEFNRTQRLLCSLVNAEHVEIAVGSGTLANDMVAMQLATRDEPGLVFSNGEFGERLEDHARRAGLSFGCQRLAWGEAFDAAAVTAALVRHPEARWCWMVHCETYTGVLNDLPALSAAGRARALAVCADCISSIGTVPVDVSGLWLATGVSTKGLGSLPGLALVFHRGDLRSVPRVPRYLDLTSYSRAGGVPFTHSSNLVGAVRVATERALLRGSFRELRELSDLLRDRLRRLGFRLLAPDRVASPGVVTIVPRPHQSAQDLGDRLRSEGFTLSYQSDYLRQRNWIQIALMGECSRRRVERLLQALASCNAS